MTVASNSDALARILTDMNRLPVRAPLEVPSAGKTHGGAVPPMPRRGENDFGDWRIGPETIRHQLEMAERHNANTWGIL